MFSLVCQSQTPRSFGTIFRSNRVKFCEVWFNGVNLKVFDVALNDQIVLEELDIFAKVGRGVAQDEIVPFQVRSNKLIINGKTTAFNNEIRVDFLKVSVFFANMLVSFSPRIHMNTSFISPCIKLLNAFFSLVCH